MHVMASLPWCWGVVAASVLSLAPSLRAQDVAPAPVADALAGLRWTGERAEVLGPTGKKLFMSRLEAELGLRGSAGFGNLQHGFVDPLCLEIWAEGSVVQAKRVQVVGTPTHQLVTWEGPGWRLIERKYVSEDDELIDELEFESTSTDALDLEIQLWGAATPGLSRLQSKMVPVALAASANLSRSLEGELGLTTPEGVDLSYDGVRFTFGSADGESQAAFLAVRGGEPGDAAHELPASVALSLPDVAPALATLHLLVTAPAPRGRPAARPPAQLRFVFDDGSSEIVSWPSIAERLAGGRAPTLAESLDGRLEWHLLPWNVASEPALRLSYVPPPGRFLDSLELLELEGPEVPVLLAATFELPPTSGRFPVHVGESAFMASPVHLVLAGEDFVSVRRADGGRALTCAVHLEPGARCVVVPVVAWRGQHLGRDFLDILARSC